MAHLFVKSIQVPLPIDLSALTATPQMGDRQFYDFCRTNPELRIERNANGEVVVMPPAFADTGNRNGKLFGQLYVWSEADGVGEALTPVPVLLYLTVPCDRPMLPRF